MDDRTWWGVYINHQFLMPDNSLADGHDGERDLQEGDVVTFDPYALVTVGDLVAVVVDGLPTARQLVTIGGEGVTVSAGAGAITVDEDDLLGRVSGMTRRMHYSTVQLDTYGEWAPMMNHQKLSAPPVEWTRIGVFRPWDGVAS